MKQITFFLWISFYSLSGYAANPDFIVAKDGSGDFVTVQDAIYAVPDYRQNRTTIIIKPGVYKEKLILPASKTNVTFLGESAMSTVLTYDDYANKENRFGEKMGTTGSSSFYIFGDGFIANHITFENSAGPVGQAVAVRIDGDCVQFIDCRFLGNQDTLYPHGEKSRQYYKDCYIEGTVDFIFGWSTVVFDGCTIKGKREGYITAASTGAGQDYGFVFIECKLIGDAGNYQYYLGRPWRPYAKTVFIRCFMDKHVREEGWHNWKKPDAEKTSFYAEYKSEGPGAQVNKRVPWSHQLTDEEAEQYSIDKIFKDWNPLTELSK